jgi:hypothetical protein
MQQNSMNADIRRELLINTSSNVKTKNTKLRLGLIAACAIVGCGLSEHAAAQSQSPNAAAAINAFNNAFLVTSGNSAYYKQALNNGNADGTWVASLDIQGEEDAYEVSGSAASRTLVNNLCATWLVNTPPPWAWDGWNDDIGWFTITLARGYQMTGTANFLTQAEYGFNFAYNRGWDTQFNGGGIWEQQPANMPPGQLADKEALSNDSLGKVACMIYQSTGDSGYLTKAEQIYDWVWHHIYNPSTGQVYTGIAQNGTVNTGTAVYNQGTFIDFANLLYEITGNVNYLNDAKKAIQFTQNNLTSGGILSNGATYLNTWADEFARGIGHVCRYTPSLWSTYYPFMINNANAAWNNRRTDYNITWNAWNQATPIVNNQIPSQCVSAVAMQQFTPATQPGSGGGIAGTHVIINQANGLAIDNGSSTTQGAGMLQWGSNGGSQQKWNFTQNSDTSWNIINQYSGQALDDPGSSTANGTRMVQWGSNGGSNQKWWVDVQSNGHYKIWNQASSAALDNDNQTTNGTPLIQWGWNGGANQLWILQ